MQARRGLSRVPASRGSYQGAVIGALTSNGVELGESGRVTQGGGYLQGSGRAAERMHRVSSNPYPLAAARAEWARQNQLGGGELAEQAEMVRRCSVRGARRVPERTAVRSRWVHCGWFPGTH